MAELNFEVKQIDFARVPSFGKGHIAARLAEGEAKRMGYPLFNPGCFGHRSDSHFMDREAASQAIAEQNPGLPVPSADVRYVIAGQQAGLLTGPLYAFLKAVSVVSLAQRVSAESDDQVLPLFWVASEDHDVLEVNRVIIGEERFVHDYKKELTRGRVPQVADISIEDAREPLLDFLSGALQRTEFTEWVLDAVASADYSSYATAFKSLLQWIFEEWKLRIVDPVRLRRLTAPVLAALVERWKEVGKAFDAGTRKLCEDGIEPPLSSIGLFEITGGSRVAVEFSPDGSSARTSAGEVSTGEFAEDIRRRPSDFSPGAALRPIVQDAVLPVAATVGGPAELAYLWQVEPVCEVVGVRPSLRVPRISATFVEEKVRRAMEKAGFGIERLFEVSRTLEASPPEVNENPDIRALSESGGALLEEIGRLIASRPDGDVPRWLRKGRDTIESTVARLTKRLGQERLEEMGLGRNRLEKIAAAVLPGSRLQERVANVFYFLNLYGPDFVRRSLKELDPLAGGHQVVTVSARLD